MNQAAALPALCRRDARKAARRDAIIDVATRHFLEHGYARTSMSGIALQMGGSKSTLWTYFAGKEELFAAVVDSATERFRLMMGETLDPAGAMPAVLERFAELYINRMLDPEAIALQRQIVAEAGRFPAIGRIFVERGLSATRTLVADYLAGQMASGQLRDDDPAVAARMLLSLCRADVLMMALWGLPPPDAAVVRSEAKGAVALFLRAFAPPA